jgi:sugar phosphate isomerase/epimerase
MSYRYAVELYAVRGELEKDLVGTLAKLKDMGYEGVEFFGEFKYSAREIKEALEKTGLEICGWHTPWKYVQDDKFDETVAYFKEIGNQNVIIPGLPGELTVSKETWLGVAKEFNRLSEKLQKHGMRIGYHNHASELHDMDGEKPLHILFSHTDPSVIVQIDNGHVLCGGADLMDTITRYPGRAKTVHLKPYKKGSENPYDGYNTMIGEDDIPWAEFMTWCKEHGDTEWYIVEYESEGLYEPFAGTQKCFEILKAMEAEGQF